MEKLHILDSLRKFLDETTVCAIYCYPLNKLKVDIPVAAFDIDKLYDDEHIDYLEQIIKKCNIGKVSSVQLEKEIVTENLNMITVLSESDADGYNFPWCVETYYFDEKKDWMIYVSHEGTITFSGKKIVEIAEEVIPQTYSY